MSTNVHNTVTDFRMCSNTRISSSQILLRIFLMVLEKDVLNYCLLEKKVAEQLMRQTISKRCIHSPKNIAESMNGTISNIQRILLESHLRTIERIDDEINVLNKAIGKFTSKYAEIMEALQTISGVKRTGAEVILAEVGPNVEQFADANN